MILLAMALLAQDYGSFDVEQTREICRVKIEGAYKDIYRSIDACISDHRIEYRRFHLLAADSGRVLAPAMRQCVTEWTSEGRIDWAMANHCAVGVADGKREYDLFLSAATGARERAMIRACRKRWTDEDTGIVNWLMAGDCAGGIGEWLSHPPAPEDDGTILVT